jgi:uncharacterized protein (TIGR02996 family)
MAGHASFVQAIREAPTDLALRLVFADFLDEQGDPLGPFIRLQFELEPLHDSYTNARAKVLREREREMLKVYQNQWLGPLVALEDDWDKHASFTFRHGLVESAAMPTSVFLEHGESILEQCPALQTIALYEVRAQGKVLSASRSLRHMAQFEVIDWITPEDARALASSPNLAGLKSLTLWLGSGRDAAICEALASPDGLPALEEMRLVQLKGGLEDEAGELARKADRLASLVDRLKGRKVAQIVRPFTRLFLVAAYPGYGLRAGRLPGNRQALVAVQYHGDYLILVSFDAEGNLLEEHRRELQGILVSEPTPSWAYSHDAELMDYLKREFGFEPASIRVKEFAASNHPAVFALSNYCLGVLEDSTEEGEGLYAEEAASLRYWIEAGNCEINWGNDYWAGPDGIIYSS